MYSWEIQEISVAKDTYRLIGRSLDEQDYDAHNALCEEFRDIIKALPSNIGVLCELGHFTTAELLVRLRNYKNRVNAI